MKFCLAVLGLFVCILIGSAQANIRATTILFRHGQRTPATKIDAMPSQLAEDIGYGQLTKFGSLQLYENGLFLRTRYLHLFPKDGYFRMNNMQLMSGIYGRAIMSLQSFMSGFFPPPNSDMNLPVSWQPFPFSVDYEAKFLQHPGANKCPKYDSMVVSALANPPAHMMAVFEAEKEALDEISRQLGAPLNSSIMDVVMLGDTIDTKIRLNESVPSWAVEALVTVHKFNNMFMEIFIGSEFKTKVRGGEVIKQVVQNMEAVINKSAGGKKILIYSGHDLNLNVLAMILGAQSQIPQPTPNLADTILIDLVDNGGSEMQVQSLYVDNSGSVPKRFVLDVPGCGKICNFSTFKGVVSKYFISDWNALCAL